MLSEMSFITIGDEYEKRSSKFGKQYGVQFKAGGSKWGTLPDAMFDKKFRSLSEGDKYVESSTYEKKRALENRRHMLTPEGFKYASTSPKPGGSGSPFGTFSKFRHETEWAITKKGDLPQRVTPQPKNIVSSTPKKGHYGTPGTTIGHGDEYKYMSCPYTEPAKLNEKKAFGAPFKAAVRKQDYFDAHPNMGVSKVYSMDRPLPPRKAISPPAMPIVQAPFKPGSPSKEGVEGLMSNPPEYKEDPYELKERKVRQDRLKNKPSVAWKPTSVPKSLCTKPIHFFK